MPFHFWAPDTYVGAPVPVAAYLSVVSKAAGFVGLALLLTEGFGPYADVWAPAVAVLAALTMTVGNLVALRQRHAVRLLAWSSIAQSGYMLVPLGGGRRPAAIDEVLPATVAYVLAYAVMNLGAFAVVTLVGRHRPENRLDDYRGAGRHRAADVLRPGVRARLPGRAAAGPARAVREGRGVPGAGRAGHRLAGRRDGRQRGDRAVLLPGVGGRCCTPAPPARRRGARAAVVPHLLVRRPRGRPHARRGPLALRPPRPPPRAPSPSCPHSPARRPTFVGDHAVVQAPQGGNAARRGIVLV